MQIRIYYEDTDAAGVVYHSNYLNYLERARTEFFRERGINVAAYAAEGYIFPVVRVEIDYLRPAVHDDLISIITVPVMTAGSFVALQQEIIRVEDSRLLVKAKVKLACIGLNRKPCRIPPGVRSVCDLQGSGEAEIRMKGNSRPSRERRNI